ncbi:Astacin-like metalloendopeptidase [Strongyloides ratti]|uniref:Metalloendopeptidase n=1 Tax=Strongyloides ratti TaxID=34506 RepID=A0A090N0F9_STRRB|nr:Astacin-like metalloendopeptidase [Strongyloides ratti]CEF70617.1 Astacin-like metalloendopeptidase [Strongyloides ratti]
MFLKYFLLLLIYVIFLNIFSYSNTYNKFKKIRSVSDTDDDIFYRFKRKMYGDIHKFWISPIYFHIGLGLNSTAILLALSEIQQHTCIEFVKAEQMTKQNCGISFVYGNQCSSTIGRISTKSWQNIILGGKNCLHKGGIQREILHTLGMFNEENRYDRDNYVVFIKKNIDPRYIRKFMKYSCKILYTYNQPYDYGSLMHSGAYAYSYNGQKTLWPRDNLYGSTIGSNDMISFIDFKTLNLHYCKNRCKNKLICLNEGYQDPSNCNRCKCIHGFTGIRCENVLFDQPSCKYILIEAKQKAQTLKILGIKNCLYHIFTHKGKRISMFVDNMNLYPNEKTVCRNENSVEIKYYKNKGVSGARFCLKDNAITIASHDHHIMIHYHSSMISNYVSIKFKAVEKSYFQRQCIRNAFASKSFFKKRGYNLMV